MHSLFFRATSAYLCRSSEPCISRQISLQFSSLGKMNGGMNGVGFSGRGQGSSPSGNSAIPHDHVGVDGPSLDVLSHGKDGKSCMGSQTSQKKTVGSLLKQSEHSPMSHCPNKQNYSSRGKDRSSQSERLQQGINSAGIESSSSKQLESQYSSKTMYDEAFPPLSASISSSSKNRPLNKRETPIEQKSERAGDISSIQTESLPMENDISSIQTESLPMENSMSLEECSLPTSFGKKDMAYRGRRKDYVHSYPKYAAGIGNSDYSEGLPENRKSVRQKQSWHAKSRESWSELEHPRESMRQVLRPGIENAMSLEDKCSLPTSLGKEKASRGRRKESVHSFPEYAVGIGNSDCSEGLPKIEPFDICHSKNRKSVRQKLFWHAKNQESRSELEHSAESVRQVLRPGMVLLKSYITHSEQVKIVKKCRELGLGPGGFYQPSYRDGAKLRLQMMCLGLNWDPETRKYDEQRPVDGSKPPGIPHEFSSLVERAIRDSHDLIKKDLKVDNVEEILPRMSPNICIANFYTTSGRLGLHQDRDESWESLRNGLPVVSFSVGDSAEFLYGDQRDVDKAENVLLESGDVLIFGGKSRLIFHGVTSIIPNSAPAALREEANIRPGRLNLTFRQY